MQEHDRFRSGDFFEGFLIVRQNGSEVRIPLGPFADDVSCGKFAGALFGCLEEKQQQALLFLPEHARVKPDLALEFKEPDTATCPLPPLRFEFQGFPENYNSKEWRAATFESLVATFSEAKLPFSVRAADKN